MYHSRPLMNLLLGILSLCLISCNSATKSSSDVETAPQALSSAPGGGVVIGTYNIHIGKGMDKQLDLARIAKVITDAKADVVGLQEVDRLTKRSKHVDQLAELERLTGMKGVYGKSIDYDGGEYGIAILVRGEVLETTHNLYTPGEESERRGYLIAKVRLESGLVLNLANTHMSLKAGDRKAHIAEVLPQISSRQEPVVFVGDFNDEAGARKSAVRTALSALFSDAWREYTNSKGAESDSEEQVEQSAKAQARARKKAAKSMPGYTFPSDKPNRRIDFIFPRRADGWKVRRAWIPDTQASDHAPLFAELSRGK